jgi:hypothetical protein
MSYLKSNRGMLKNFILAYITNGHLVSMFLVHGHYFNIIAHI